MTDQKPEEKNGVLDNLKAAGKSVGHVVGEFVEEYKKDRTQNDEPGEHALPDPVDEKQTMVEQIKAAGADARAKYSEASGFEAVKNAAGAFAGHAEGIVRDVAGSVVSAAERTRESGVVRDAREDVGGVLSSVRDSVAERFSQEDDVEPEEDTSIIDGEVVSTEIHEEPLKDSDTKTKKDV